jgi:hypothetical protein
MEITYQLQEKDLGAVAEDLATQSPAMRRQLRRALAAFLLGCLGLSVLFWLITEDIALVSMMLLVGTMSVLLVPVMVKRARRRLMTAITREGENRALFLPTTLSIDRDRLTWRADSGSGHVKFEYIERIRQTGNHLLIYLTVRSAYIVPRHGVTSGDFDSFAWDVERRWRSAMDAIADPHEAHSL